VITLAVPGESSSGLIQNSVSTLHTAILTDVNSATGLSHRPDNTLNALPSLFILLYLFVVVNHIETSIPAAPSVCLVVAVGVVVVVGWWGAQRIHLQVGLQCLDRTTAHRHVHRR
jgi:hypothetical protein